MAVSLVLMPVSTVTGLPATNAINAPQAIIMMDIIVSAALMAAGSAVGVEAPNVNTVQTLCI